jgi:hypothetical protein
MLVPTRPIAPDDSHPTRTAVQAIAASSEKPNA